MKIILEFKKASQRLLFLPIQKLFHNEEIIEECSIFPDNSWILRSDL